MLADRTPSNDPSASERIMLLELKQWIALFICHGVFTWAGRCPILIPNYFQWLLLESRYGVFGNSSACSLQISSHDWRAHETLLSVAVGCHNTHDVAFCWYDWCTWTRCGGDVSRSTMCCSWQADFFYLKIRRCSWGFRFSQRCCWTFTFSGTWRHLVWLDV